MPDRWFRDRRDAGATLAGLLDASRGCPGVVVLGLPRSGVPTASEAAIALGAPLDVFVVGKPGVPGHEEAAIGAIASGAVVVLNDDVMHGLRVAPGGERRQRRHRTEAPWARPRPCSRS